MDAVEILALQQVLVAAHVPGHVAGFGHDLLVGRCGDKALLRFLEVAFVLERQALAQGILHLDGIGRWQLALGVEVLALHGARISLGHTAAGGVNRGTDAAGQGNSQSQTKIAVLFHVFIPLCAIDIVTALMRVD